MYLKCLFHFMSLQAPGHVNMDELNLLSHSSDEEWLSSSWVLLHNLPIFRKSTFTKIWSRSKSSLTVQFYNGYTGCKFFSTTILLERSFSDAEFLTNWKLSQSIKVYPGLSRLCIKLYAWKSQEVNKVEVSDSCQPLSTGTVWLRLKNLLS